MNIRRLVILLPLLFVTYGCCTGGRVVPRGVTVPVPESWNDDVGQIDLDLFDTKRDREVPVRVYIPKEPEGSIPVVVLSHGIGESRESYAWLGRAIAAAGFAVIHPTHRGTDRATLEQGWLAMYRATKDRDNWRNRVLDISYLIDELDAIEQMSPLLHDTFDGERIGVVGHSAGAWTAAAIAGLDLASGESLADPRIDAIAPLSMPRTGSISGPEAWSSLKLPALHMTGTCDTQLIWRTFPRHRRIPWEYGNAEDQYLLTLDRGRHTTFSNEWDPSDGEQATLQNLIAESVSAFLKAYVAGDAKTRDMLRSGGFRQIGDGKMTVEQRPRAEE